MSMHNKLCSECMKIKPTGLSSGLHDKWRSSISGRPALERSVETLTVDHDLDLLRDGVCFDCEFGVTVIEHIKMIDDKVEAVEVLL